MIQLAGKVEELGFGRAASFAARTLRAASDLFLTRSTSLSLCLAFSFSSLTFASGRVSVRPLVVDRSRAGRVTRPVSLSCLNSMLDPDSSDLDSARQKEEKSDEEGEEERAGVVEAGLLEARGVGMWGRVGGGATVGAPSARSRLSDIEGDGGEGTAFFLGFAIWGRLSVDCRGG